MPNPRLTLELHRDGEGWLVLWSAPGGAHGSTALYGSAQDALEAAPRAISSHSLENYYLTESVAETPEEQVHPAPGLEE